MMIEDKEQEVLSDCSDSMPPLEPVDEVRSGVSVTTTQSSETKQNQGRVPRPQEADMKAKGTRQGSEDSKSKMAMTAENVSARQRTSRRMALPVLQLARADSERRREVLRQSMRQQRAVPLEPRTGGGPCPNSIPISQQGLSTEKPLSVSRKTYRLLIYSGEVEHYRYTRFQAHKVVIHTREDAGYVEQALRMAPALNDVDCITWAYRVKNLGALVGSHSDDRMPRGGRELERILRFGQAVNLMIAVSQWVPVRMRPTERLRWISKCAFKLMSGLESDMIAETSSTSTFGAAKILSTKCIPGMSRSEMPVKALQPLKGLTAAKHQAQSKHRGQSLSSSTSSAKNRRGLTRPIGRNVSIQASSSSFLSPAKQRALQILLNQRSNYFKPNNRRENRVQGLRLGREARSRKKRPRDNRAKLIESLETRTQNKHIKTIPPKEAVVPFVEGTEDPVHTAIVSLRKRPRKNQTNKIPRKNVAVSYQKKTELSVHPIAKCEGQQRRIASLDPDRLDSQSALMPSSSSKWRDSKEIQGRSGDSNGPPHQNSSKQGVQLDDPLVRKMEMVSTQLKARTSPTGRRKNSTSVASIGNDSSRKKRIRRTPDVDKNFLDFAKRRLNEIDVELRGRNKLLFRNIAVMVAARIKRVYGREQNGNGSKNKFLQRYRKWIVKQLEGELAYSQAQEC